MWQRNSEYYQVRKHLCIFISPDRLYLTKINMITCAFISPAPELNLANRGFDQQLLPAHYSGDSLCRFLDFSVHMMSELTQHTNFAYLSKGGRIKTRNELTDVWIGEATSLYDRQLYLLRLRFSARNIIRRWKIMQETVLLSSHIVLDLAAPSTAEDGK